MSMPWISSCVGNSYFQPIDLWCYEAKKQHFVTPQRQKTSANAATLFSGIIYYPITVPNQVKNVAFNVFSILLKSPVPGFLAAAYDFGIGENVKKERKKSTAVALPP